MTFGPWLRTLAVALPTVTVAVLAMLRHTTVASSAKVSASASRTSAAPDPASRLGTVQLTTPPARLAVPKLALALTHSMPRVGGSWTEIPDSVPAVGFLITKRDG